MYRKEEEEMIATDIEEGTIVQINPAKPKFGGMLLCVTEVYSWGVQGYLFSYFNFEAVRYKEKAFVRVNREDFEIVGCMAWLVKHEEEEQDE